MNKVKWKQCREPGILVAKLAEETGEVAKAYLDWATAKSLDESGKARENWAEELEHVEFIAGRIREEMGLGT